MIETLILSIVQGVTEFLPISSSSHLIIISKYINFQEQDLSIDVSLHVGSFIAVLFYYYKEIFNLKENKYLVLKILISSTPVMLVGIILIETNYINALRSIKIIGWMTIVFGILLYISDKFKLEKNIEDHLKFKTIFIIGFFQIFSLIPGVSRSGVTITAARLLNFKRFDAAKISFLLSIPTLGAVSIFGLKNILLSEDINLSTLNLSAMIFSFIFSLVTIKFFLKYIKKFSLSLFVIYRVILGIGLLIIGYS